jgi:hypothetical protein
MVATGSNNRLNGPNCLGTSTASSCVGTSGVGLSFITVHASFSRTDSPEDRCGGDTSQ